ncbi:hypothetical protein [Streptomyces sp. BE230]|uniref:hypothetical protein n=1 Tax=Streptomyces sp. BE230 TaxID=3002526 RepID=UPI002ED53143|nr:hypothetical protein [Streptomyces sp. BE230]
MGIHDACLLAARLSARPLPGRRGQSPAPLTDDAAPASASATGTAEQLLLFVWGRLTMSDLKIEGDQQVFERLIAWEPEEQPVNTPADGGGYGYAQTLCRVL